MAPPLNHEVGGAATATHSTDTERPCVKMRLRSICFRQPRSSATSVRTTYSFIVWCCTSRMYRLKFPHGPAYFQKALQDLVRLVGIVQNVLGSPRSVHPCADDLSVLKVCISKFVKAFPHIFTSAPAANPSWKRCIVCKSRLGFAVAYPAACTWSSKKYDRHCS